MTDDRKPKCFIARPVGDHGIEADTYGDKDHWQHVEEHLFAPALKAAGYDVVSPEADGAVLIHGNIVKHLETAECVLADFSTLNPNVLFEAGVRTSVNKPLVIVAQEGTKLPFDTTGINTWFYPPALRPWNLAGLQEKLRAHISNTPSEGNALWGKFGLQSRAADLDRTGSPEDARIQILTEQVSRLTHEVRTAMERMPVLGNVESERSAGGGYGEGVAWGEGTAWSGPAGERVYRPDVREALDTLRHAEKRVLEGPAHQQSWDNYRDAIARVARLSENKGVSPYERARLRSRLEQVKEVLEGYESRKEQQSLD